MKGFDEPHDERGAFRDVLKHLGHFVVSATHQTGLIDTLDVVTDLFIFVVEKKTFRHFECEWKKCLIYLLGKVSVFFFIGSSAIMSENEWPTGKFQKWIICRQSTQQLRNILACPDKQLFWLKGILNIQQPYKERLV